MSVHSAPRLSTRTPCLPAAGASLCAFAILFLGCDVGHAGDDVRRVEEELRTSYADLFETLDDGDLDRWVAAREQVTAGFDRICGDTICSGDFSNLTTVRLACSSTRATRKMKDCLWVLGGSIDRVDGRTGALTTEARTFACHVPVAGTAGRFVEALEAAGVDALYTPLPGVGTSMYDALVTCFEGVGAAPSPATSGATYVALADHLWDRDPAAGARWSETLHALGRGFDAVCGDTFCEGDYPNIVPLRLACAVNARTNRVKQCAWSFAAAELNVDERGRMSARAATKRCHVPVNASAADLATALAVEDPLHAPLPNGTATLYDALVGCL